MSFSVSFTGTPGAIKKALAAESEKLTGQSKAEFDAVVPALETILDQEVDNGLIMLKANGHASLADGVKTYGSVSVSVEPIGSRLVTE